MHSNPILLVEDDDNDARLIQDALASSATLNPVHLVRDGHEAIEYLSGIGLYADRKLYPLPELVLLDLSLPKVDGFEVLAWARHRPDFATIPIVVLTGSLDIRNVNLAYKYGATSFLTKPVSRPDLLELLTSLAQRELFSNRAPSPQTPPHPDLPPGAFPPA